MFSGRPFDARKMMRNASILDAGLGLLYYLLIIPMILSPIGGLWLAYVAAVSPHASPDPAVQGGMVISVLALSVLIPVACVRMRRGIRNS